MKRVTKSIPVSFRMGIREKRELEQYCDQQNQHMSEVMRSAVNEYLQYIRSTPSQERQ
jgi:hypothetical protein